MRGLRACVHVTVGANESGASSCWRQGLCEDGRNGTRRESADDNSHRGQTESAFGVPTDRGRNATCRAPSPSTRLHLMLHQMIVGLALGCFSLWLLLQACRRTADDWRCRCVCRPASSPLSPSSCTSHLPQYGLMADAAGRVCERRVQAHCGLTERARPPAASVCCFCSRSSQPQHNSHAR